MNTAPNLKAPTGNIEHETLIVDDERDMPAGVFGLVKKPIDIQPGEMWPDGKIRPHMIKTKKGEKVWLTDDEFDQLKTAARHRYHANPVSERKTVRPVFQIGTQILIVELYSDGDCWRQALITKIKADGTLRVNAIGLKAGLAINVRHIDDGNDAGSKYKVTSAWHRGAHLRPIYS